MKDSQVQTGRQSVFRVDDCFIDNIKEVHPYSDVLEGLCKGYLEPQDFVFGD